MMGWCEEELGRMKYRLQLTKQTQLEQLLFN